VLTISKNLLLAISKEFDDFQRIGGWRFPTNFVVTIFKEFVAIVDDFQEFCIDISKELLLMISKEFWVDDFQRLCC
jgi:hypothetical protein